MEISNFIKSKQKIHFIGIGGVSMSALAKHLKKYGYYVSGSDICTDLADELTSLGIEFIPYHHEKNVKNSTAVIFSSAISEDNVELVEARKSGALVIKRSVLLGMIAKQYRYSIGISGSHGKTTCTSMLAHIFKCANKQPTVFLGGVDRTFNNYCFGKKEYVIAEACEYKKNLLDLRVDTAVILNIDNDHLDSYSNMVDMITTFEKFSKNSLIITNADDENCRPIFNNKTITFGINKTADFMAKRITKNNIGYSFTCYAYGQRLGRINLKIMGKHNVYNALSAMAVANYYKIPFEYQKQALEGFLGVDRRNEYLGKIFNLYAYADYAHHPKELSATINAFNEKEEKYITVFQPHTYSRTKFLMNDFISVLINQQNLIILDTYSAREKYDESGSAKTLYQNMVNSGKKDIYFVQDEDELKAQIEQVKLDNQSILFLGAGDIYQKAKKIIFDSKNNKN